MSALDQKPPSETRPTGIGPGDRLQAARIQKGLSLEDVANRMHLSPGILEAIEENDFEEITAPIFVKGYLRAYARIVSLDEDEMIQQYIDYYSGEDPPISSTSNMAPELSVTDARIKWTTYLVVLVLIALLGAWWWNKAQNEEQVISLDAQPTESQSGQDSAEIAGAGIEAMSDSDSTVEIQALSESEIDAAGEISATDEIVAESETVAPQQEPAVSVEPGSPEREPPPAAETEPVQAPPPAEPAITAALEAETAPAAADEPAPAAEPASDAAPAPAAETAALEAEPESAAAAPAPGLIAPAGDDRLVIVVNADSWADIKDGSDFQMVYDLLRAQQTLELIGAAPFSVFLGYAPGVEIRFNGEVIDFSSRVRGDNTARLRVGG